MLQNNHLSPHAPMGVHFSLFHAKINMQTIIDSLCQVVTIGAMDTHKEFSKKIRSKRANYVLALKRNQENLYEDVSFSLMKKKPIAKLKFENTIRPIRLNG